MTTNEELTAQYKKLLAQSLENRRDQYVNNIKKNINAFSLYTETTPIFADHSVVSKDEIVSINAADYTSIKPEHYEIIISIFKNFEIFENIDKQYTEIYLKIYENHKIDDIINNNSNIETKRKNLEDKIYIIHEELFKIFNDLATKVIGGLSNAELDKLYTSKTIENYKDNILTEFDNNKNDINKLKSRINKYKQLFGAIINQPTGGWVMSLSKEPNLYEKFRNSISTLTEVENPNIIVITESPNNDEVSQLVNSINSNKQIIKMLNSKFIYKHIYNDKIKGKPISIIYKSNNKTDVININLDSIIINYTKILHYHGTSQPKNFTDLVKIINKFTLKILVVIKR